VAETLLFRNFGSKANLFGEAVLLPMAEFFESWVDEVEPNSDGQATTQQNRFVDSLYDSVAENRGLLLTSFATAVFEPEVIESHGAAGRVRDAIARLADSTGQRLDRLGVDTSDMDVGIASAGAIAMILAVALFEDWLLPHGRQRPSRVQIVKELTRQILYGGFNQRPPAVTDTEDRGRNHTTG
jgi:hypothetical protein